MNFNSLTIGKRISLGFAALLVILVLIGGYAVVQMSSAAKGAGYLSNDYIPEVSIAGRMQAGMADVRVNGRSYQYTGDPAFLEKGKEALNVVKSAIKEFETLAAQSTKLVLLKEQISQAPGLVSNYEQLLGETQKADEARDAALLAAGKSAAECMKGFANLLDAQNGKLKKAIAENAPAEELNERHGKVTQVNNLLDILNALRIENLRSQATRDSKGLDEALVKFQARNAIITAIRPLFHTAEDIQNLKMTDEQLSIYEKYARQMASAAVTSNEVGVRRGTAANALEAFSAEISKASLARAEIISTESSASLGRATKLMLIGVGVALVLGIVVAFVIARSLVKVLSTTAKD
ncbi:MAG: MCP four helix bundle domain-containing protein, partial [bacterium]